MQGRGHPGRGPRQLSASSPVGCVIVAAGSGTRLAAGLPKAFVTIGGRTLIEHALDRVQAAGCVDDVVVVVPPDVVDAPHLRVIMQSRHHVSVVAGGPSRQASVRHGLDTLPAGVATVLVHDAARCLTPPEVVRRVADAVAGGHPAVVPVVAVSDTIRHVDGTVEDRDRLRAVQTPQGFAAGVLAEAHRRAAARADDERRAATDDAGLVEQLGVPVHLVEGSDRAFKITTPLDLRVAELLLEEDA